MLSHAGAGFVGWYGSYLRPGSFRQGCRRGEQSVPQQRYQRLSGVWWTTGLRKRRAFPSLMVLVWLAESVDATKRITRHRSVRWR